MTSSAKNSLFSNASGKNLPHYIEHTVLKADAVESDIERLCQEAIKHNLLGICIHPKFIKQAKSVFQNKPTPLIITVVGFPLGTNETLVKAFETEKAIDAGADEIDMVISIGELKNKNHTAVLKDIQAVVKASGTKPVKVILETGLLKDEEIILGCKLSEDAGALFVKTSTGFAPSGKNISGATVPHIQLMRKTVSKNLGVKASGGIRNLQDTLALIEAGANRIGTSSTLAILEELASSRK